MRISFHRQVVDVLHVFTDDDCMIYICILEDSYLPHVVPVFWTLRPRMSGDFFCELLDAGLCHMVSVS